MKKSFTAAEKAAVALEALAGVRTFAEISSAHQVHSTQISSWKKQAKDILVEGFGDKRKKETTDYQQQIANLHQLIGQGAEELAWFKKKLEPFGS